MAIWNPWIAPSLLRSLHCQTLRMHMVSKSQYLLHLYTLLAVFCDSFIASMLGEILSFGQFKCKVSGSLNSFIKPYLFIICT